MNAWLLTWEGTSGSALRPDTKVVAILSARKGASAVAELVDALYCRCVYSAYDSTFMANKRQQRQNQFRAVFSQPSRLFYGRNPCIFARRVSNLQVVRDEARRTETISWLELPYMTVKKSGEIQVVVKPESQKQIVRALEPLSADINEHAA